MSSTVARTVDRPIGRYAPPDWHARNSKLSEVARNTRDYSHALRQEAKQLRIDAEAKTKWFNYENNVRLNDRYDDKTESIKVSCFKSCEGKIYFVACQGS